MLDLDAIRERIRSRYEAKALPATGVWHKDHGMGQTTVRNFLDGMTQSLTLDTVQKLETPLGVSAEWILFGDAGVGLSGERIQQMVSEALDELQPGMSIAEIRRSVSAVLHDQLSLVLTGVVQSGPEASKLTPVEGVQPQITTN